MNVISAKDREILRELATHQLELATSDENKKILEKWDYIAKGKIGAPTVRFLVSNFTNETIDPRMRCEGEAARELEAQLLFTCAGRDLFGDDTPITNEFVVKQNTWVEPFGNKPDLLRAKGVNAKGFHINPIIEDLEEDFDKLLPGFFGADLSVTEEKIALAKDVFGDILDVKAGMESLTGAITNPLVHLMTMENYYMSMYDYPELIHKIMDNACNVFERYYDFLEEKGLLLPTCGVRAVAQESFAFNSELPTDKATKTTDVWGFLESQETTAVSPEDFAEFVFPYQDRMVKRFGLLSYGCCERVDAIFPQISKWKNLRKLSVSPFNNEPQVGEYLRGTNIVYYSKPRSEYVTLPGPLDEDAITNCFKKISEAASGCMLEVAQREVGTIFGDYERGRRYVQLAKEAIEKYWKP
ncbi:MAG: hypothetical protein IKZ03_01480 [Clostridia bacterium]|nr:hypothetical protein [Clostridia bacterium]